MPRGIKLSGTEAPGFWQVICSVAGAFFGVQNSRVRERDFTRGRPMHFIVVAFAMTGLVVLGFYLAVQLVMHHAAI